MSRCRLLHCLIVVWPMAASFFIVGWAAADVVDLSPLKDNTIYQTPVENSNGAGDGIFVGRVGALGGSTSRRGLIAFDLSAIPAGSTVNSASLTLQVTQTPNSTSRTFTLHRASADWGEAGSVGSGTGGVAEPGDATWLERFFGTLAWTTAGGDFVSQPSASQSVTGLGTYVWTGAGLAADVQAWLDNAAPNFGWLVKGDETTTTTARKFSSKEGVTPPKLTIDYTSAATDVASNLAGVRFDRPWPTPAVGPVHLRYALPRDAHVSLLIHDARGRMVRRLATGEITSAGSHSSTWDGRTDTGTRAASGVYFATLVVDNETHRWRVPLLR